MIYFRKNRKMNTWKLWEKKLRDITDSFRIVNAQIREFLELEKI